MTQLTNTWYKKVTDQSTNTMTNILMLYRKKEKKNHVPTYTRTHTHAHSIFKYSIEIFNHRSIRVVCEIMQENLLKKENPHSWKPQITSMTHEAELLPLSGEYRRNAQEKKPKQKKKTKEKQHFHFPLFQFLIQHLCFPRINPLLQEWWLKTKWSVHRHLNNLRFMYTIIHFIFSSIVLFSGCESVF